MSDRASELRAIADGRLMLNVRNGVTVARSMLARIADEFEAIATALAAKDAELAAVKVELDCALIREGNEKHRAKIAHQNMNAEINARERAEAQLAEATDLLSSSLCEMAPISAENHKRRVIEFIAGRQALATSKGGER